MIQFKCELKLMNAKNNRFEQIIKEYPCYIKEDKNICYYDLTNEIKIFVNYITKNNWATLPHFHSDKHTLEFDSYLINDLFRLYSFYKEVLSKYEIFKYIFDSLTITNTKTDITHTKFCFSGACKSEYTVFENKYGLYEMIKRDNDMFNLVKDVPYFIKYN